MKKTLLFITFLCFNQFNAQFGGATCIQAQPTCGLNSAGTPNVAVQPFGSPGLGKIDCLNISPNASWLYFQVGTSGNLDFTLKQGNNAPSYTNLDVDFVLWGPFNTLPNTAICGNATGVGSQLYDYPSGNISVPDNVVACSYSTAGIENFSIIGAQSGKYYILLVTNFSAQPGFVVLQQTNLGQPGAATTNCDIVCGAKIGPNTTSTYPDPPNITDIELCSATISSRQLCANFVSFNASFPGSPTYQWYLNGVLQPGLTTRCINASQAWLYWYLY
jgi:hypothetical protein